MNIEEIREELQNKIHELEWRNTVRSLELINWMQEILKKLETKPAPIKKEVRVELPEEGVKEEKKSAPKRKITFKKK